MIALGALLGLGPDWWGAIASVVGVIFTIIGVIRRRRKTRATKP